MLAFLSFDFDLGDRDSGGGVETRKNIIKLFFVFKYVWVLVWYISASDGSFSLIGYVGVI